MEEDRLDPSPVAGLVLDREETCWGSGSRGRPEGLDCWERQERVLGETVPVCTECQHLPICNRKRQKDGVKASVVALDQKEGNGNINTGFLRNSDKSICLTSEMVHHSSQAWA